MHHSRAYFIIFILSLVAFIILFLTSITFLPIYQNLGAYETAKGEFIMLSAVLWFIAYKYYSRYKAGLDGEKHVINQLSSKLNDDFCMLNDVVLPNNYGNIDHVITSRKGLFVIETKNNGGDIKFYRGDGWNLGGRSPISQVNGNARALWYHVKDSKILLGTVPYVKGVVVFPRAEITKYDPESLVCKLDDLHELIIRLSAKEKKFSQDELEKINDYILNNSKTSESKENTFARILWNDIRELFNK